VAVRTLVVSLSPFLRELVRSVLEPQISLDAVEVLAARELVAERIRKISPDLVLLGLKEVETEADADAAALQLLAALSNARVLVLAHNGESAWLYGTPGRRVTLSDLSVASLKDALRAAFAPHSDQAGRD
jgi:chemotaxis response regulator CheB